MRIIVIGAGPSGLAIALGLVARGANVTVLDRASSVGGRVRTLSRDGYTFELGPAGILDGAPDTRALLASLGDRAPSIVEADKGVSRRYLVRNGKPRPLPSGPVSLLFGSALSVGERLALVREPFMRRRTDHAPESVAAFARRRFGVSLAETLAQPMVLGVFGGDYAALELKSAFPAVAALETEHGSVLRGFVAEARARRERGEARPRLISFEGGMGSLPAAMAKSLGDRVQLDSEVTELEPGNLVRLADGRSLVADHVVFATEHPVASRLTRTVAPELADALAAIPSTPIASVTLGWPRSAVGHSLAGFGLLSPRKEGLRTMGVLFMTSIFPTAGVAPPDMVQLRAMVGGGNDPDVLALSDEALILSTCDELSRLLAITGAPAFSHLARWPQAIAQYRVGHSDQRVAIEAHAAARGLVVAGTALHGVGVNDVIRDAARIVERLTAAR